MRADAPKSPEERELQIKKSELAPLESELAERELELATLQAELRAFESHYLRVVGIKFAERDELQARIAEARARQRPQDTNMRQKAAEARSRAKVS